MPDTLQKSYQLRLESILDNIVDGLVTIDERGIIQSYNKACERIFGYSADEAIGQNVKMLMPEPYSSQHDGYLNNYMQTGKAKIIGIGRALTAKKKDGTIFPMDLSVAEVKIGSQRLFSGIIRDMTERRSQEDQLRHAQKMEAVGQLTSGVAHDFNNLLTVILGNTRLIRKRMGMEQRQPVFDELTERVDDIDIAAQRGADLVRRLMIFTRQRPMQKAPVDINGAIGEARGLLSRALTEAVELRLNLSEGTCIAQIDHDQFINALINLTANARDAMPDGGILTLTTSNGVYKAQPCVHICVSDTGVGMPPEIKDRIFEPFFTTKAAGDGTGLGLSMVYGFIEQSGAYIEVESEPGKGTAFNLYLPAAEA